MTAFQISVINFSAGMAASFAGRWGAGVLRRPCLPILAQRRRTHASFRAFARALDSFPISGSDRASNGPGSVGCRNLSWLDSTYSDRRWRNPVYLARSPRMRWCACVKLQAPDGDFGDFDEHS